MDAITIERPRAKPGSAKSSKPIKGAATVVAPQKGPTVTIASPNFTSVILKIRGTAPYVQHAFSQKALNTIIATQQAGSQAKKGQKRAAKDFDEVYEAARHVAADGWSGIPAAAFRNAMISACRTVGFKMTLAKLSLFIEPDGFDGKSGDPLVKITKGQPKKHFGQARNSNGSTDIRCRPMWDAGWEASVKIRWDADQFNATDVINLMSRVGLQVGVGEGRADSRMSNGLGWGHFEVIN